MRRKPLESEPTTKWAPLIILLLGLVSCFVAYVFISILYGNLNGPEIETLAKVEDEIGEENDDGCCRGIENLELWGSAVKWGSEFKVNSSEECCQACKAMCTGNDGPCLCDSWVFCSNKMICREKFGECWLKKQKDTLAPLRKEAESIVEWTSGLIFGKGEIADNFSCYGWPEGWGTATASLSSIIPWLGKHGIPTVCGAFLFFLSNAMGFPPTTPLQGIVGLETELGTLRIKLLPDCSPHSVMYMLELLELRHCAGCHFYRAEGLGQSWDSQGKHIKDASFGPPFALIQGTLEAHGANFDKIPSESSPTIRRGSVAWVGSGPEFFISLANHHEWKNSYTVFGTVLPEDMVIADKIAELPAKSDVWHRINVSVLEKPVPLRIRRVKTSQGDLNLSPNE